MPFIGQAFRFGDTTLTLDAVHLHQQAGPVQDSFTLIFSGPKDPVMPEDNYDVSIPGGPALTLYTMPINTTEPGRQDYQVIFN